MVEPSSNILFAPEQEADMEDHSTIFESIVDGSESMAVDPEELRVTQM